MEFPIFLKIKLQYLEILKLFLSLIRIGGTVLSMVWDRLGRHLAIIFENSPLVAIYRTDLVPHLLITPK